MGKEYHVAVTGCDSHEGTMDRPFATISRAAMTAMPGDTVTVHGGEYREWVKPENGGSGPLQRIVYRAAEGERVVIKGSEQVTGWENIGGDAWRAEVPNTLFGDYNPYQEILGGDWFIAPQGDILHAGEVYLNGKAFYEAKTLEEVKNPVKRIYGVTPPWSKKPEKILHPEDSLYQWCAEVKEDTTVIYANFQGADPNHELVEINVRRSCFYPVKTGRNYITVSGFEMAQAACPWTPPTADQPGLLGVNWSKGWIIENNVIHDAKCSGISIGKEESTGHNLCSKTHRKPGYQYQMEAVFRARHIGWSKESIGSHVIRNNRIYDCGQNGIVGHMGCAFSEIYGNHIYNIAVKHEFFGYEIAGIKLHAAIDVQIRENRIHNCTLGTWLDWQAQGARVSRNLYYNNDRDLMVEVTHGPYLVDNNIFASKYNFDNVAQGGAYLYNLCCGIMRRVPVLDRSTPYHYPHTTEVAGTTVVYGGDDRLYRNIFLGGSEAEAEDSACGTVGYNDSPTSLEEYIETVLARGIGDLEMYLPVKQPAYINDNCYLNGADPFEKERDYTISSKDPEIHICEEKDAVYLEITADREMLRKRHGLFRSGMLDMVRIVEAAYETPEGEEILFDTDYCGCRRDEETLAGPFADLKEGVNRIRVWG